MDRTKRCECKTLNPSIADPSQCMNTGCGGVISKSSVKSNTKKTGNKTSSGLAIKEPLDYAKTTTRQYTFKCACSHPEITFAWNSLNKNIGDPVFYADFPIGKETCGNCIKTTVKSRLG